MTASVLPARNTYNDYHVKYHSVSGGSALSQSMKYAEAWLYGSWNVRPSLRTAFLNFDRHDADLSNSTQPTAAAVVCYCSQSCNTHATYGNGKGKKCCKKYGTTSAKNLSVIQGFGTVRNNRLYRNLIPNEDLLLKDPYDAVRQSRLNGLNGIKCATVRAKSYSPSKRKQITTLMSINRLPSPEVKLACSDDGSRRSILECNVNPYELLRKSFEEDGSSLISDDDLLLDAGSGAKSKKQRSTLRNKFKTKIQDSKPAKMLMENFKSMKKDGDKSVTDTSTPTNGVSIAGQKIRVFSTPPTSTATSGTAGTTSSETENSSDDWVVDEPTTEEEETATSKSKNGGGGGGIVEESCETPKRPPRRKTPKTLSSTCPPTKTQKTSPSSGIYQNYKAPTSTPPPTPPSSTQITYSDIKSILKKPLATSSSETGKKSVNVGAGMAAVAATAAKLNNYGTLPVDKNSPGGGDTGKNFYSTTFNGKKHMDRKVKKQVQFKGMQEHTVEDESGSKSNVNVDATAINNVVAETGYNTENTTTSSAELLATPVQPYSDQTLTADDDKSNGEHHLRGDYGRKVTSSSSSSSSSSLPSSSSPFVNDQCKETLSDSVGSSVQSTSTFVVSTCKSGE